MLGEGATVRIIHVLRKPLSEGTVAANTLKHGCGGLNIDASRIGTEPVPINRLEVWSGFGQKERPAYVATTSKGRWPANMILQHLDGCRCDGVKRVKETGPRAGGSGSRFNDPGNLLSRKGHEGVRTDHAGLADKDGKETVANWICEPGCPVARLDEQSGDRSSPWVGNPNRGKKGGQMFGGQTDNLSDLSKPEYQDTGGASRFYKQVGGKSDG